MIVNFTCTHKHIDVNAMYFMWCKDSINSRQCFASHSRIVREVKITPPHPTAYLRYAWEWRYCSTDI